MLVEVLIVVAIMAMLSTGVAVAAYGYFQDSKLKTAETNARNLRHSAQLWRTNAGSSDCPSMQQLMNDGAVDETSNPKDPWNSPWELQCKGEKVTVLSKGPDRTKDTEDDIIIPALRVR